MSHLCSVDKAKHQSSNFGSKDQHDDHKELRGKAGRVVKMRGKKQRQQMVESRPEGHDTLTKPRPTLDSRMVAQHPTRPKMNITALMQMMIAAGIRVYLSWMKLSKLS